MERVDFKSAVPNKTFDAVAAQLSRSLEALGWYIAKTGIGKDCYTLFDDIGDKIVDINDGHELVRRLKEGCAIRLTSLAIADKEFKYMLGGTNVTDDKVVALCETLRRNNDTPSQMFLALNRSLLVPFEIDVRFPVMLGNEGFLDRVYDESILWVSLQSPYKSNPTLAITKALSDNGWIVAPNKTGVGYDCSMFDGSQTVTVYDTSELLDSIDIMRDYYVAVDTAMEEIAPSDIYKRWSMADVYDDYDRLMPEKVVAVVNSLMEISPCVCENQNIIRNTAMLDTFNRFADKVTIEDIAKLQAGKEKVEKHKSDVERD